MRLRSHTHSATMRALSDISDIQYEDLVDRELYGFPRRKIVFDVKYLLYCAEIAIGRENKINRARDMFTYLATPDCKKFIQTYRIFRNGVKKKLLEFRYKEELREAQRWYRDIFGMRIPIE